MTNHEEEKEYIFIPDDEGNDEKFEILYSFETDDEKKYLLVVPADLADDEEEAEVYAFRYEEENDDLQLFTIETDEEWDMIEEVLNTLDPELI